MYCPECGKKIPDEADFCPECGVKIIRGRVRPTETKRISKNEPARSSGGGGLSKILLAALVAAGVWIAKPFIDDMIGSKNDKDGTNSVISGPDTSSQNTSSGNSSAGGQGGNSADSWILNGNTSSGRTEASAAPSAKTENTPVTQQTPAPDKTPAPAAPAQETAGHGSWEEGTMPQSLDYLTAAVFDDFIYPERLRERGLPENCERLALYEAKGAWKYELIFKESDFKEIGACLIDFGQNAVLFDLYPSQYMFGSELYYTNREEMGYTTYYGAMEDDIFSFQTADKGSTAVLGSFARIEGTEFGFGSIVGYNGDIVDVLLTRP